MKHGLIIQGIGGFYYVETADGVLECKAKGIFRKQGITPLAGDRVSVQGDESGFVVADIEPRKNSFVRPPVANVDNAFLVVSTVDPRPNILVLDKLTALCMQRGILPAVVFTKTDLAAADDLRPVYEKAGFPVFDTGREADIARLLETMQKGLSVFIGNSGVGKSTLLNRLAPELALETGQTSKKLGRGRHTTRAVTLYPFGEGYVADTPGFSALDMERAQSVAKEDLAALFPEFHDHLDGCFFTGCSHTVEKGCAVLEALRQGEIAPSRHESYCALYKAAAENVPWGK